MNRKVFVGGLPWAIDDEGLRSAFEPCGTVEDTKVILDRETGRSRGFGFVTFSSGEEASQAITQMDGTEIGGRQIQVKEAEERARQGGGGKQFGGDRGGPRERW